MLTLMLLLLLLLLLLIIAKVCKQSHHAHNLSANKTCQEHVVVQTLGGSHNGWRPLCLMNCSHSAHVNTASLPSLLDTPMWSPENKVLEGLYSSTTEPSVWPGV